MRSAICTFVTAAMILGTAYEEEERSAARLKIAVVPVGQQQRGHVVVRVDVTNEGDVPVTWDKEFSLFLQWSVETDDGTEIEPAVASIPRPPSPSAVRQRFTSLKPGQTLSREIELTKGVRRFLSGHSDQHAATGFEEVVRYDVPKPVNGLRIQVRYDLDFDDRAGFSVWFRHDFDDFEFWEGVTESNACRFELN